jgi:hypothetical protein
MSSSRLVPALVAVAAITLPAVEDPATATNDLRIGVGFYPVPETTEKVGGTSYDWKDTNQFGQSFSVMRLYGPEMTTGTSLVWGYGARYVHADLRPDIYVADGVTYQNNNNQSLQYHQLGLDVAIGLQHRGQPLSPDGGLTPFGEILAVVGGAAVQAQTAVDNSTVTGTGWAADAAIRVGGYLIERRWMYGVTAGYVIGVGEAEADTIYGTSTLTLDRLGLQFGFEGGYRF